MNLNQMANAIRALSMDAVEHAKSGHPGMPMGMADVATVLFAKFLKFNPKDPSWPDRDRFVLSAGHGSMLLYSLIYLTGYKGMMIDDLKAFRSLGSKTAGHPEYGLHAAIETTTGPLGQGFGNGVGMALAERGLRARFGTELCQHKTYVIVGDGCLMEGISQEALSFAGHQKLNNLIVLFDDNGITIDGRTDLSTSEDHLKRFEANGWVTKKIDGHNTDEIEQALSFAQNQSAPVLIACKTKIGFGAPTKVDTAKAHGSPLGPEEIKGAKAALNWPYGPFEVPDDVVEMWRTAARRNDAAYQAWQDRHAASSQKGVFDQALSADLPQTFSDTIQAFCSMAQKEAKAAATRKSSEQVISLLHNVVPNLLGGSADLTGSNNTKGEGMHPATPETPKGAYVYYGIREHGMAAIMNGIALHKGFIPFGGTFLAFSDYCRPAIRLSALMKQRVVYVMTHDSIGLGEDGPTHQPVEQLSALRLIPDLHVLRPADTIETAECWEVALRTKGPSLLALTRQNVPLVRKAERENLSARGGYVLRECADAKATLIATGSEVCLALETAEKLEGMGYKARIVSMPCLEIFDRQDPSYKNKVLGDVPRISIEAGRTNPWHKIVGDRGLSFGVDTFGESAPATDVYTHFGLTPDALCKKIKHHLETSI